MSIRCSFSRGARSAFEGAGAVTYFMVDEMNLLDLASVLLLRQLLANGVVFLIGTVLTGVACAHACDFPVPRRQVSARRPGCSIS